VRERHDDLLPTVACDPAEPFEHESEGVEVNRLRILGEHRCIRPVPLAHHDRDDRHPGQRRKLLAHIHTSAVLSDVLSEVKNCSRRLAEIVADRRQSTLDTGPIRVRHHDRRHHEEIRGGSRHTTIASLIYVSTKLLGYRLGAFWTRRNAGLSKTPAQALHADERT
jgi:hypothetical protein